MKRLALLAAFLALPFAATHASAYTCNASGCTWEVDYTEPSTLTNGQALTDLAGCSGSYTTSVDGAAAGAAKSYTIAASKPTGGGVITNNRTDATMVAGHTYAIAETVACTSTAFGTGAPSAPAALIMNNGVTTQTPSGVTLK